MNAESVKGRNCGIRIVVLHRGWVVVGRVRRSDDVVVITDASVIHRWGTAEGLGELRNGPTDRTILHYAGTVRVHPLAVVLEIDCDSAAWDKVLVNHG